jgi:hypothetical protein
MTKTIFDYRPDYLVTIDVNPKSPTYSQVYYIIYMYCIMYIGHKCFNTYEQEIKDESAFHTHAN